MDLTDEEKHLLEASRNNVDGDAAVYAPLITTIAENLGISLDVCTRILGGLKKKGMITDGDEGLSFQLTLAGIAASEL
jgi:DNA-binding IclR family transcriptional regulator